MAAIPVAPLANWKVPPIGQAFDGGPDAFGLISGLAAYTEGGGRAGVAHGLNAERGRHLVFATDYLGATIAGSKGRWLELITLGDSDLPNGILTSTPTANLLRGRENFVADPVPQGVDVPDFASQLDHVFMADGEQRMQLGPGGFGASMVTRVPVHAPGGGNGDVATWSAVIRETGGGGTFADETANAINTGIDVLFFGSLNPAINDALYFARGEPFLEILGYTVPVDGVGTWTLAYEYFDGATWSALPGLVDNSSDLTNLTGATLPQHRWNLPDDWAPTTIDPGGINLGPFFYMRIRITAVTTPITTNPQFRGAGSNRSLLTSTTIIDIAADTDDAYYWGFENPVGAIWVKLSNTGAHAGGVFVWERWNGSAWTSIVPGVEQTNDFTAPITTTDWFLISFGTFSTQSRNLTDPTGAQDLFWIRYRYGVVPTVTIEPNVSASLGTAFDFQDPATNLQAISSPSYTGAAYHIPDDPGTVAPRVVGWGIPLPENIGATVSGLYTFWDPISEVRSRRFDLTALGNGGSDGGFLIPPYFNDHVTQVAQWSDTTEDATLVGTFEVDPGGIGQIDQLDLTTADAQILAGEEGGPPTTANENLTGAKRRENAGTYASCALHRDRMWCAASTVDGFANHVIYSSLGRPHNFPGQNVVDVDIDDGDRIIGLSPVRDILFVFKNESVHVIMGNPGQGNLQVKRVLNRGLVAKRSRVVVGGFVFFLSQRGVESLSGSGAEQPLAHSQPIRDLVRNLTPGALAQASAVYDERDGLYLLSAPGIQAQMPDANGPGEDLNDGILAYHIDTGQWSVYTTLFAASLVSSYATSQTREVVLGTYWGDIQRLSDVVGEEAAGQVVAGVTYRGTLTSTVSATVVSDGFATWLTSDPGTDDDKRMIGQWMRFRTGPARGQSRMLVRSNGATTQLEVFPAYDNTPQLGDEYEIGSWPWVWESGDQDFGAPEESKRFQDVQLHQERQLAAENVIDLAVDNTDEADTDSVMVFAPGTVRHESATERVQFEHHSGGIARVRLQGSVRDRRPRLRALTFSAETKGSPDG